jgi:hypothetical protein
MNTSAHNIQEMESAWTHLESNLAVSQGWDIFETNRDPATELQLVNGKPYGHRPFEIQRVDEMDVFAGDDEAHAFVRAAAEKGDQLAGRALAFLQAYSPLEHAAICSIALN